MRDERSIAKASRDGEVMPGRTLFVERSKLPPKVQDAIARLESIPDEDIAQECQRQGKDDINALGGLLVGCALGMTEPPEPPELEPLQWAARLGRAVNKEKLRIRRIAKADRAKRKKDKAKRRAKRKATGR